MNDTVNRQILLVEKPSGKLGPEHFKMSKSDIPEPKDGEVLVRVRYISLDAANRARVAPSIRSGAAPFMATVLDRQHGFHLARHSAASSDTKALLSEQ